MATVKIVLRTNYQKKDGSSPLALRITKNRKTRYVFTGKYVFEKDWDKVLGKVKRSHPNSGRLNNYLVKKVTEADDIILETDASNDNVSSKALQQKVQHKGKHISFFEFASERIKGKYIKGTFSVAKPELSILYNIQEFMRHSVSDSKQSVIDGINQRRKDRRIEAMKPRHSILNGIKIISQDKSLYFEDIDTAFLNKFKIFCTAYLGQKTRTITNELILIRTLFNAAIKEGIVDIKHYPFAGEKEKIRIHSGHKIGLTREEIYKLENIKLEHGTSIWHTRNIWLFAFYFAGIRISDVLGLKWSDFKDGRLFYVMNKNEKPLSLKIPDKAKIILKHYEEEKRFKSDYVFPYLKKADQKNPRDVFVKSNNASRLFNKYLKRIADMCEIDKNLSNHISRHSFGNIAGDAIHPLMLQKLYRHSDLKTTLNYQANFIHKDADDALDKVINF